LLTPAGALVWWTNWSAMGSPAGAASANGGEVGLARNEGRPQRRRLQRGEGGAGAGMIVEQAHERAADQNRPGGRGNAGGQQPARVLRLLFKGSSSKL
jgi:hypothetical protein